MIQKSKTLSLIKKITPYFKKYKKIFILDLLFALIGAACKLIYPILLRHITNIISFSLELLTINSIMLIGLIFLIVSAIEIISVQYMTSVGHIMGAKIETEMRKDLFNHIQKLHVSYHDNNKIGQLMSRLTTDLFEVTEFAHHCPEEFLIAGVKIIMSFIILCHFNIYLTLIIYSTLPFIVIISNYYNKKMQKALKKYRVQVGELNSQVEDSLLGIRVIKSFAGEEIEGKKFNDNNLKTLKTKQIFYKILGKFRATEMLLTNFMDLLLIVVGSIFLIYGQISPGDLVAYVSYISILIASISKILTFTEQFQQGLTGISRFTEVMETNIDIKDSDSSKVLTNITGKVDFKNVWFKYSGHKKFILKGINLSINHNENIALVGPSGAGKTTMCALIERFYDVTDGQILIDNTDIRDIKLNQLHKIVGLVHQNVHLFTGSIYDNICYGDKNASLDDIVIAAKKAGIHDFIDSLPNKYDTYVGERGIKLSGGQKQRISIARVFLKNPQILILDEATSALDSESEKIIQESLEKLSQGRTTITIAHRLTSIKKADKIYVINDGKVVEQGTHKELILKSNLYKNLYQNYIN